MAKLMWYAVDKDGRKSLYSTKPIRNNELEGEEEEEGEYWVVEDSFDELILDDDNIPSMGLPDMSWEDEPIQVKMVCVNV